MSFVARIDADIGNFRRNLAIAQQAADDFSANMGVTIAKLGQSFIKIGGAISLGVTTPLLAAGTAAYNMAADFEDSLGAVDQIFKQSSAQVSDWAKNLDSAFGISKKEALEYSNVMGSMLINIGGLTEDQAAKQSAKLIELAGDLTAMYGGTTQDAVRALTGALKGNNTMLDNYGMAANDALVKAKALSLGLVEQGKEMSLAAKQTATLALIYEQSGAAQGQAAREADGASGSMRAFKTEVTNLTTELGNHLLPLITPIIQGLKNIISSFRSMTPEAQKTTLVIAGITAAIGPLLVGLGTLMQLAPLVGAAFAAITGPIGIAVIAVGAAASAIIFYWDDIKRGVLNSIASMQRSIAGAFGSLAGWADKIGLSSISKDLKGLSGEFNFFANNTTQKANEVGAAIKRSSEATKSNTSAVSDNSTVVVTNAGDLKKAADAAKKFAEEQKSLTSQLNAFILAARDQKNIFTILETITDKYNGIGEVMGKIKNIDPFQVALVSGLKLQERLTALTNSFKALGGADLNVKGAESIQLPEINTSALDKQMSDVKAEVTTGIGEISLNISEMISETVINSMSAIGTAIAEGGNVLGALGNALLGTFGSIISEIGKQLVVLGAGMIAARMAIKNPYLALAAGAAMVALGAAFSAGASKSLSSIGGGGGYSQSAAGTQYNSIGDRNTGRLFNNDKQVVELRLKNGELTGAINLANKRNDRLV